MLAASACSSTGAPRSDTYTIVVAAPLTSAPWVGRFIQRGAQLAVDENPKLRLRVVDDAGSPRAAADAARKAVRDHAAALITDGVGTAAIADIAGPAKLPVFVVFDGGSSIIDPVKR